MRRRDQVFWIQKIVCCVDNITQVDRVHVVNLRGSFDEAILTTDLFPVVSKNDVSANVSPFRGSVEPLVDPSIGPKGHVTHSSVKI